MSKLKSWEDIEKDYKFTPEEDAQMELELNLIKQTIEAKKD